MRILDLHGEYASTSRIIIQDFINECYNLKEERALIVHGGGSGVLMKVTHQVLAKDKRVKDFGLDMFNGGTTYFVLDIKRVNEYNNSHNLIKGVK